MIIRNLWLETGHECPPIPYVQHTNAAKIRFNLRDYTPPENASAYAYIETCTGTAALESADIITVTIGGTEEEQEEIHAVEFSPSVAFFDIPGPAVLHVRVGLNADGAGTEYVSYPIPVRIIKNGADAVPGGNAVNIFDQYLEELQEAIESAEPIELAVVDETISWKREHETTWTTLVNLADLKGDKGDKGDKGATGAKGDKGDTGPQGPAGADGVSPTATVTQTATGAVITITDATGTTTATVNNGENGDTGATGAKGDKGDKGDRGATGAKGDKGDTGPQGPAGADGHTPVKGTDYWTAEDKAAIVQDVLNALPAAETASF